VAPPGEKDTPRRAPCRSNANAAAFNKAAQDAKAGCPISRLLSTEITLSARLA
jgi:organic hydroperoxide reductase OsmC/OhrA